MFRNDALRALKHTDYRWYLAAAILSSIGTWMQTVALGWVTYELTASPLLLGVVSVVPMLPVLPISILAGVLTDRFAARWIIVAGNLLALGIAIALTLLSWTNGLDVWHLILLNFFLASAVVVDHTARKVFNTELVGKEDVGSAVGLNTATNYVTRIIGPGIAGVAIVLWGPTICFLLNAFTFLPLILLLFFLRTENKRTEMERVGGKGGTGILAGYLYALKTPRIRNLLIVATIAGVLVAPYILLMPVYSKDAISGGADSLGLLMAIAGVGSVLGALWAAGAHDNRRDLLIVVSVVAGAAGLLGLSLFTALPLALILVFIIGIFDTMTPTLINTSLQVETEDRYLGRVMSLLTLLLLGAPRIGVLMLGALAEVTSITVALGAGALTCLVVGGAISFLLLGRRSASPQALAD